MKHSLWLALGGCASTMTPDSAIQCDIETADHPNAAALQAVLDERVANGLPGLAVAVETPDGVWQGAAGWSDLERQTPLNPCNVHPHASVGKTWNAALALRLQSEGRLDLDTKLADVLGDEVLHGIPNADRVTVRQIMNHTSGIPDINDDPGYLTHELDDPLTIDAPDALLDWVRGDAPLAEPGAAYAYADTNYVLLVLAIDAVTGDYRGEMDAEVLAPLGLDGAVTFPVEGDPDPAGRVNAYWEVGRGRLENVSDLQAAYDVQIIGAGNVRSTPEAALTFISAVARGDALIDADARAQMTDWTQVSARDDGWAYGLGLARHPIEVDGTEELWIGHTGGDVGAGSFVMAREDAPYAMVGFTNVGMFLGGPLGAQFDESLLQDLAEAAR